MSIQIALRQRPFSHVPGSICPLPKTPFFVQAYPTRIVLYEGDKAIKTLDLPLVGIVEKFLVTLDLEEKKVVMQGFAKQGYFRLHIGRKENAVVLEVEKFPVPNFFSQILAENLDVYSSKNIPRISLGCHKAQNVEKIFERKNITEMIPFWIKTGFLSPDDNDEKRFEEGNFYLLNKLEKAIQQKDTLQIEPILQEIAQSCFMSLFTPKLVDDQFLGIIPVEYRKKAPVPPLKLSCRLAKLLFTLFIQEEGSKISILPVLPPSIHSGRIAGFVTQGGDILDIEWSKKELKKMVLWGKASSHVEIFVNGKRECRWQKQKKLPLPISITTKHNEKLLFDRFTS